MKSCKANVAAIVTQQKSTKIYDAPSRRGHPPIQTLNKPNRKFQIENTDSSRGKVLAVNNIFAILVR